jgi:trk system potassium uptake protein TrkA
MYAIVLGAGEVGFHLTRVLAQEGHNVTVVDVQQESLDRVSESLDVRTLLGNGVEAELLDQAETERADLFLAVTDSDEVNLLAGYVAHQFGARTTISRVGNRISAASQLVYRDLLGIDLLLSTELLAATEITKQILTPGAVDVESFAQGKVQLRQLRVGESSKAANRPIQEIDLPKTTLIASLSRNGKVVIPRGDDVLEVGTDAIVIGQADALPKVEKLFGHSEEEVKRIVVLGGGEVGFLTAQRLETHGLDVRIIERDAGRCTWLSEALERTVVLRGDGTDLGLLKELRLPSVDYFVSASGDDEENLMSGLLAKEHGANRTIALVDRSDYTSLYERLGITFTISPRLLVADHILRFIRRGNVITTAFVLGEQAEALELVARPKSKLVGRPLRKVKLPRGALIGAVVRDDEVIVPRGDDVIHEGDTVVMFTLVSVRSRIEKLL